MLLSYVCLSDTLQYYIKMAKTRIMQTVPHVNTLSLKHATFTALWVLQRFQTSKVTIKLTQYHWQSCHSIGLTWFPINLPFPKYRLFPKSEYFMWPWLGMLIDFLISEFLIVLVFVLQKLIIVTEIAHGDDAQFQDAMHSCFNTTLIVMGGWTDDEVYTMQFMP